MKRCTTLLLPLLLLTVSCGITIQYPEQRFADGIYGSRETREVHIYSPEEFEDMAALDLAARSYEDQKVTYNVYVLPSLMFDTFWGVSHFYRYYDPWFYDPWYYGYAGYYGWYDPWYYGWGGYYSPWYWVGPVYSHVSYGGFAGNKRYNNPGRIDGANHSYGINGNNANTYSRRSSSNRSFGQRQGNYTNNNNSSWGTRSNSSFGNGGSFSNGGGSFDGGSFGGGRAGGGSFGGGGHSGGGSFGGRR